MKTTQYLKLEKQIALGGSDDVVRRWSYGRALLKAKVGRKQLPDGLVAQLIKTAERAGLRLSEREIQYRLRSAEAYQNEAQVRTAVRTCGSWTDLREAGFPPTKFDGTESDLEADGLDAPDYEQLQLDIPGLKPVITARGRKVPVVKGQDGATVADVAAYVAMCQEKHENFGKTVDQARQSLHTMREGCGGDETANAVEAWEAGIDSIDSQPEFGIAAEMEGEQS